MFFSLWNFREDSRTDLWRGANLQARQIFELNAVNLRQTLKQTLILILQLNLAQVSNYDRGFK